MTHEEKKAFYGIRREPVDYFHFKTNRYSNLDDAIAEAKRLQDAMLLDRTVLLKGEFR